MGKTNKPEKMEQVLKDTEVKLNYITAPNLHNNHLEG